MGERGMSLPHPCTCGNRGGRDCVCRWARYTGPLRILLALALLGCTNATDLGSDSPVPVPIAAPEQAPGEAPLGMAGAPAPDALEPSQPPPVNTPPVTPGAPDAGASDAVVPLPDPTDAGSAPEPDAGCVLPADEPWDCHAPTCAGEVTDDTDAQPWNPDHPQWAAFHPGGSATKYCLMVTCKDGVPNSTVWRADGVYNSGDGVCYRCGDGIAYFQACP